MTDIKVPTEDVDVSIYERRSSASDPAATVPAVQVRPPGVGKKPPCDVCRSTGLAILPTRYAVVPDSCSAAKQGLFGEKSKGCETALFEHGYEYTVRTLRQGMLYLYYEDKGPYGGKYWEAYAVAQNGTLWRQAVAAGAKRIVGAGVPSCSRTDAHVHERMEFIVIQRPELCGKVWIAFSQEPWSARTLKRYEDDSNLRTGRMQLIEPSKWISSPQLAGDLVPLETEDRLISVMEYRPYTSSEPADLPHLSKPRRISGDNGSHYSGVLKSNSTRYPWSLRNSVLTAGAPRPLANRYRIIQASSHAGGEQRKPYVPMMIKLWDPIGLVHELNGYRNDVIGHVVRYRQEQELPLNAKEHIDEIATILQNNAAVEANQFANASRAALRNELKRVDDYVESGLRTSEKTIATESRQAYSEYIDGKISWAEYISRRNASIAQHADLGSGWDEPGARRQEINRRYAQHDGIRHLDTSDQWSRQSAAMLPEFQREAREKWENKYKPLIDWPAYEARKTLYDDLLTEAARLLEVRSHALRKWLANPLFLAALEDYDTTDLKSGINFEVAITEALLGLGADKVGREYLDELARNFAVTSQNSLLWRVVAMNQDDARQELADYLKQAEENKSFTLQIASASWSVFVAASSNLKKFIKYYKSYEELKNEIYPDSFVGQQLKQLGIDHLVVNVGDWLMKALRFDNADKKLGEYMVQHLLSIRALMDPAESSNLITTEAAQLPAMRQYYADRVRHYAGQPATRANANLLALADLEQHKGIDVMRQKWQQITAGARSPIRLAALTTVLELVNFANLVFKADKQAKDYGSLVSSGLSLASSGVAISTKLNETLLSKDSASFARVKFVGALFGGVSSSVATFMDIVDITEAAKRDRYALMFAYVAKSMVGALVAGAQLLGVVVYSTPVLERVVGRGTVTLWLTSARFGIEGATALRNARVMGGAAQAVVIRQGALIGVGRAVLFLAGWEVAVAVLALQGVIWVLSPNALEVWCERNYLGKKVPRNILGFGGSDPKYKSPKEQSEAFDAATSGMQIKQSEA